jgi:hypothetical protein
LVGVVGVVVVVVVLVLVLVLLAVLLAVLLLLLLLLRCGCLVRGGRTCALWVRGPRRTPFASSRSRHRSRRFCFLR